MMILPKPKIKRDSIIIQELDEETLIYDMKDNKAFCLNSTSALVWQLSDGTRTVLEISKEMSRHLKELVSEDFILLALDQFQKDDLLENEIGFTDYFAGFSRREVIKKIGLTSLVTFPIVLSVVVPQAIMAQSGAAALGQPCTLGSPSTCSTNNCLSVAGNGICCSSSSNQANSPGYTICSSDSTTTDFAVRCCSGSAAVSPTQGCPTGQTRYSCANY